MYCVLDMCFVFQTFVLCFIHMYCVLHLWAGPPYELELERDLLIA